MKRYTLILGTVVAASLLSTPTLALDRANTSQKGSLLVFPKVDVTGDRNTIIRLQNDYSDSVSLKCYWKNGTKFLRDFQLELTKFQPIWISARDGGGTYAVQPFPVGQKAIEYQAATPAQPEIQGQPFVQGQPEILDPNDNITVIQPFIPYQPFIPHQDAVPAQDEIQAQDAENVNQDYLNKIADSNVALPADAETAGELQCWAVGAGDSEIRWNHLAGSATVVDPVQETAYEYNAWGFRCLVGGNGEECVVADAGKLDLDGTEYEACPKKLIGHFNPAGGEMMDGIYVSQNELTIASCNQDLNVADLQFHFTSLKLNVWDKEGSKYTGASQCMDSWHSVLLDDIHPNFTAASLNSDVDRFNIKGIKSTTCERSDDPETSDIDESIVTENTGLLGVLATTYGFGDANGLDGFVETGTNLRGVGSMSGFISYDPSEEIEERSAR